MLAVVLREYGDADKLELREWPEPEPGPGEIKIRVAGTSINPLDSALRSGRARGWMPLRLPTVLGHEASGEVVAVGPGVRAFRIGAQVLGLAQGAHAEYVVAQEEACATVPPMLDVFDAAALPVVTLTGWQLIDEAVQPRSGAVVLVIGAVGSVGRAAVYAARLRGAKVVAAVRRKQKDEAAKLRVADVIALDDDADLDRVAQLDAIAMAAAVPLSPKLLGKLAPRAIIGTVTSEPVGAKHAGFVVRTHVMHADAHRLAELARAAVSRELFIPIAKRLPLSQIREAYRLAESGPGGKVLLRVRDQR